MLTSDPCLLQAKTSLTDPYHQFLISSVIKFTNTVYMYMQEMIKFANFSSSYYTGRIIIQEKLFNLLFGIEKHHIFKIIFSLEMSILQKLIIDILEKVIFFKSIHCNVVLYLCQQIFIIFLLHGIQTFINVLFLKHLSHQQS